MRSERVRANSSALDQANCPEHGNTVPLLPVGVPREVPEGSVCELRTLRGALTPGFPPPRGIGDSPRIMHDKRLFPILAHRGALTYFERRALLAEIPAWGEAFGRAHFARACLDRGRRVIPSPKRYSASLSTLRITGEANSGRAAAYFVSSALHSHSRRLLRLALRINARRI